MCAGWCALTGLLTHADDGTVVRVHQTLRDAGLEISAHAHAGVR